MNDFLHFCRDGDIEAIKACFTDNPPIYILHNGLVMACAAGHQSVVLEILEHYRNYGYQLVHAVLDQCINVQDFNTFKLAYERYYVENKEKSTGYYLGRSLIKGQVGIARYIIEHTGQAITINMVRCTIEQLSYNAQPEENMRSVEYFIFEQQIDVTPYLTPEIDDEFIVKIREMIQIKEERSELASSLPQSSANKGFKL